MNFQLHLDTETIDHALPAEPYSVEPGASVRSVIEGMQRSNRGSALIHQDGRLVGIFTERDALRLLARGGAMDVPIQEVMTTDPETLSMDDPVGKAISKMVSGGFRRLPVVDSDGRAVGVLTVSGILHYLVEHFPSVVYTLPPNPHHSTQEREGA